MWDRAGRSVHRIEDARHPISTDRNFSGIRPIPRRAGPLRHAPSPKPFGLYAVDSLGNTTFLNTDGANSRALTPAGDGRIYYVATDANIRYIDAANAKHDVLNQAGTATYKVSSLGSAAGAIHYDAATNCLFFGYIGLAGPVPAASPP